MAIALRDSVTWAKDTCYLIHIRIVTDRNADLNCTYLCTIILKLNPFESNKIYYFVFSPINPINNQFLRKFQAYLNITSKQYEHYRFWWYGQNCGRYAVWREM